MERENTFNKPLAVTIGNFDGFHLGHRKLVEKVLNLAQEKNLTPAVLTFRPHPIMFFAGLNNTENESSSHFLINSYEEKERIVESLGISLYIEKEFNKEFASLTPYEFAHDFLFGKLNCKAVVVGEGYRFAKNKEGDLDFLRNAAKEYGAVVVEVPSVEYNGYRVSSSRIRNLIKGKDLEETNAMLFEPYFVKGIVRQGKQIGRQLGFPTINLLADPIKLLPPDGVYFTKTRYKGEEHCGITNIGNNPTVEGKLRTVETYLFDFDEVVYGKSVEVAFYGYCRSEVKFESLELLKEQIEKDKQKGLAFFQLNLTL